MPPTLRKLVGHLNVIWQDAAEARTAAAATRVATNATARSFLFVMNSSLNTLADAVQLAGLNAFLPAGSDERLERED
jgi:hypothetical protein